MGQRHYTRTLCWVFSWLLLLVQWFAWSPTALAQTPRQGLGDSELPTVLSSVKSMDGSGTANVLLPDWDSITFSTMPAIQESGAIDLKQHSSNVGYDLSRSWQAGMSPDQYLKMGDLGDSLRPQDFTLGNIAQSTNLDLNQVALSAFKLLAGQTIAELAERVPFLKDIPVREIAPIADLISQKITGVDQNQTLGQALGRQPEIGEHRMGEISLDPYSIASIPNLDTVQLGNFSQWQNAFLQDIPGLGNVPVTQFPRPLVMGAGVVSRIDQVFGPAEAKRDRTISGSTQVGFAVPCEEKCAYIELDDVENVGRSTRAVSEGFQWISGRYQLVPGGQGLLANVNGGMEPTGRHPFGSTFKVVVWEPDETTDTVTTAMFFRYCHDLLGCTPYFIGPVPFFTYRRDSMIFVGVIDRERSTQTVSQPTDVQRTPGNPAGTPRQSPQIPCTTETAKAATAEPNTLRGVNLGNLQTAIAARESGGDYTALGTYGCDQDGLCGRALGRYQFMSYNESASDLIVQKPGGQEFLDRVRDGATPTQAEIMQFFPPADQESARQQWFQHLVNKASGEIDPKNGQPFQGLRLLERVGQMHYGGEYSPIDAGATQEYGTDIARRYQALGGGSTQLIKVTPVAAPGCVSAPQAGTRAAAPPRPTGNSRSTQAATPRAPQPPQGKATGKMIRPVDAPITSGFGMRVHPIRGEETMHTGVDFGAAQGTPVRAADGGRVVEVVNHCRVGDNTCGGGYGNYAVIDHGNGRQTLYAHLMTDSVSFRPNSPIKRGQVFARVGSTGWSTGPHLHYETLQDNVPVDPIAAGGL